MTELQKNDLLIQNIRHKFVFKMFEAINRLHDRDFARVGTAFKNSLRHSNSLEIIRRMAQERYITK